MTRSIYRRLHATRAGPGRHAIDDHPPDVRTTERNTVVVCRMALEDVQGAARVHLTALPLLFTSALGHSFLVAFYGEALRRDEPVFVALDQHRRVTGVVMGTLDEQALYRSFAFHNMGTIAIAALQAVATHPRLLPRLVRAGLKPVRVKERSSVAGLLFLAVDERLRGKGTGRALVNAFIDDVRDRGARLVELETERIANPANDFYAALGFSLASRTDRGRQSRNTYVLSLVTAPES